MKGIFAVDPATGAQASTFEASDKPRWDCPGGLYGGTLRDYQRQALSAMQRPVTYEAFVRTYTRLYSATPGRPMLHFVRFKDDRYLNAVKAFGRPDFIHRHWDARAVAEVMPGDVVVFAEGDEHQAVTPFSYDDSAFF